MSRTLQLAEQLIACRSVTPDDGGCQALIAARLRAARLRVPARDRSGPADGRVTNLWALRRGRAPAPKLLAFAGHTDVVPTGPLDAVDQRPVRADATATACCTAAAPPT